MAASLTDKLLHVGVAGTLTTMAAPGKAEGASTVNIASGTNWPTDTAVVFAVRQVDADGELVPGTYTEWIGTLSGTALTITPTPVYGTDQVYTAGSTTQVYVPVSAYCWNLLITALLVSLDQDGTLKAGAVDVAGVLANNIVDYTKVTAGAVVQVKTTTSGAVATGATVIPLDDTVPTNAEGFEVMTLAITPKATTHRLNIHVQVYCGSSVNDDLIIALYQDSGAAIAAAVRPIALGGSGIVSLDYEMAAGTVSETTFKVRLGGSQTGTRTFNGRAGAREFGAITKSAIVITETKA